MTVNDILPFAQNYIEVVDDSNISHKGFIANLKELKSVSRNTSDIQLHLCSGLTYDYLELGRVISVAKTQRNG